METSAQEQAWEAKLKKDLGYIEEILTPLGFSLDNEQLHISGERFLMTRNKLVLSGENLADGKKVIIKISDHPDGQNEIKQEKKTRDFLSDISFSRNTILFPQEIYFGVIKNYLIWISEFISQNKVFVAHTLEEQFFIILRAFESQESFHATTFEHQKKTKEVFESFRADDYLKGFENFKNIISKKYDDASLIKTMDQSEKFLQDNKNIINTYCNYLTHTDFVPHNFRVEEYFVYMLDCSAVHFGNKYEGWARFLNYMAIHNPALERSLSEYILKNRNKDEYLNLQLMRIYKIGYLLKYYVESLQKTSGDLNKLTQKRIGFWHEVLKAVLKNDFVDKSIVDHYLENRDYLRSAEEKKRQKEFAIA